MATRPSPRAEPPLAIEPVIGWRVWCLEAGADGGVGLVSPMQSVPWVPMRPSRATCHLGTRRHRVPTRGCMCGFYATSSLRHLPAAAIPLARGGGAVVGSVALWGTVVEHAAGYRATFAYPDRLRLACGPCLLEGRDGLPTRVFRTSAGSLIPRCRAHRPQVAARQVDVSPCDLERELLATYAVDLLPVEVLHEAGFQAGAPRTVGGGLMEEAKAEWHDLVRSWAGRIGGLVLALVLLWMGRGEFLVSLPAPSQAARPQPTPAAPLAGSGDPARLPFVPLDPARRPGWRSCAATSRAAS